MQHICVQNTYLHRQVRTLKFFMAQEAKNQSHFYACPQSLGHFPSIYPSNSAHQDLVNFLQQWLTGPGRQHSFD